MPSFRKRHPRQKHPKVYTHDSMPPATWDVGLPVRAGTSTAGEAGRKDAGGVEFMFVYIAPRQPHGEALGFHTARLLLYSSVLLYKHRSWLRSRPCASSLMSR